MDKNRFSTYDQLISSNEWRTNLVSLNEFIAASLQQEGLSAKLNGNIFYSHLDDSYVAEPFIYVDEFEDKRRNLFALAQASTDFLEIGVNAGHSLLLTLMANPDLKVVGIDVCERLAKNWAHVQVYVPAAFCWLQYHFPNRVEFIKGNSLVEIPRLALAQPNRRFDMLHLDGSKFTHLQEFISARAILAPQAWIIHDDINLRPVKISDRQLRKLGFTKEIDQESAGLRPTVWQVIRKSA